MESNRTLKFISNISKNKPNSITNKSTICPFCDKNNLTDIIDIKGQFIFVKNKYNTLEDTLQTVLIESDNCDSNISLYTKEHMRSLINFGVKKWMNMDKTGEFKSVIFYKNHGIYSGGSIKHPHMQIIGLKYIDYTEYLRDEFFEGITIEKGDSWLINISTKPKANFTEFNIIIDNISNLNIMADNIQIIVRYILNDFQPKCNSFNIFFYNWKNKILCKITPRFITSPLFIGFSISQVSDQINRIVNEVQRLY
ncbi:DUF4931 domain-containing protein [Clostridium sp. WILCCON 0269]|uniref:DUF4931 domain-containing protein n=1 Tax=Candidatus Clostridium eludens TaxID=3381663 RepID=A0ABW8SR34_9CLOT